MRALPELMVLSVVYFKMNEQPPFPVLMKVRCGGRKWQYTISRPYIYIYYKTSSYTGGGMPSAHLYCLSSSYHLTNASSTRTLMSVLKNRDRDGAMEPAPSSSTRCIHLESSARTSKVFTCAYHHGTFRRSPRLRLQSMGWLCLETFEWATLWAASRASGQYLIENNLTFRTCVLRGPVVSTAFLGLPPGLLVSLVGYDVLCTRLAPRSRQQSPVVRWVCANMHYSLIQGESMQTESPKFARLSQRAPK